mgnify:CR=1 FL=1|tara:strand:+ start:1873 stop:3774 length:1902 start_codon:yes stop_codon:yes gene_type:complete
MQKVLYYIPEHLIVLIKRLSIAIGILFLTRFIFLIFNYGAFSEVSIFDFILGLWFDTITVSLFFVPFYVFFLIPFPNRRKQWYRISFKALFHLTNTLIIALNLIDVEYFKYTSKRSTFDLFSILGAGNDLGQLVGTFLTDFWFLILFLIILVVFSEFLYRKTESLEPPTKQLFKSIVIRETLTCIIFVSIFIIIGRGSIGLRPVGIIEASTITKGKNTSLVLNTPFTMIKTIDQGSLEKITFFTKEESQQYFNPIHQSIPQNILPDDMNVMIIMLESFGKEFVGKQENGITYTPFLDSIEKLSLSFKYGFANGKKSIEAVPAIIASMPTLMDNPYISSPFGNNKINTIPNILAKHGYESAFYHGATNGSMRFDGFTALCGFDQYFGRFEYNNDEHFDKTWGILDEYFNRWTAKKMSELKEPFFSTLFTISSHHPYFIPEHMKNVVTQGPQKICASVNYGDHALRNFFTEAKKQPWFNNTVFVIMADHTPASVTKEYNQKTHLYQIPIMFYDPLGRIKPQKSERIFQQLDVLPTILDLLNIETNYYSFGNSYFQDNKGESLVYLSGTYYYFNNKFMTTFIGEKARNLQDFTILGIEKNDSLQYYKEDVDNNENRIKAMIQRYSEDLNLNQTTIK